MEQSTHRTQAILSWQRSPSIDLRVEQDDQHRYLILNGQRQSQMRLQHPTEPSYPHLLMLLQWLAEKPWCSFLQLGLGGGELSRVLAARWPDRQIISVEQEPLVIAAFLKFFQPQPHPNETIICADALTFAQSSAARQQQFDVIFVDIFPWPEHWQPLMTALLKLRSKSGLFGVNVACATTPAQWQQYWQELPLDWQCLKSVGYQNQLWLGC